MLEEIETAHGKPVISRILSPKERRSCIFSMGYNPQDGCFHFGYIPENPPTQVHICHELLHACLLVAGWPNYYPDVELEKYPLEEAAIHYLKDLAQHIVVWPMMEKLGYNEVEASTAEALEKAVLAVKRGILVPGCHPDVHVKIQAAILAHILLCPIEEKMKGYIRDEARRTMPQESLLAAKIVHVFEQVQLFSPKSCQDALDGALEIAGWPKECLLAESLRQTYPHFLEHILEIHRTI